MFKRKGGGAKAFWTMLKKTALFSHVGFPNCLRLLPLGVYGSKLTTLKLTVELRISPVFLLPVQFVACKSINLIWQFHVNLEVKHQASIIFEFLYVVSWWWKYSFLQTVFWCIRSFIAKVRSLDASSYLSNVRNQGWIFHLFFHHFTKGLAPFTYTVKLQSDSASDQLFSVVWSVNVGNRLTSSTLPTSSLVSTSSSIMREPLPIWFLMSFGSSSTKRKFLSSWKYSSA